MKTTDFMLIAPVQDPDTGDVAEPYFSWRGCDIEDCPSKGLGNTVYDIIAYRTLSEAQEGPDNRVELQVCDDCLYFSEYGKYPG